MSEHVQLQSPSLNISAFINELLNKRGLREPTGSPLFTYQLTEEEYIRLKSTLRASNPTSASFKNALWCAAYCLFSAEWYRREYSSGWSWHGILVQLNFDLDANDRSRIVIKGLNYWCRPINKYESNRNDYLGSVYCEGGLPFALLASEGSRFQNLFKKLLVEFDKAKSFGRSALPLIEQQLERMPDAFKEESTINLLHEMVSNLYGLIDTYTLEEKHNPPEYLDSIIPAWRASFPIPLDTTTGDTFLAGLLNSAAEQRKETKKKQGRLRLRQWLRASSELSFSACIELSNKFTIPLTKQELSAPIVEVLVYEGNAQIADFGIARAEFNEAHITLNMRKTSVIFRRRITEVSLSVVVVQAGRVRYVEEIPASSVPLNDMPVVLEEKGEKNYVVGCGSISKQTSNLNAIFLKDAELDSNGATIITSSHIDTYLKVSFCGELCVHYQNADERDTYILSTKEDSFSKDLLEVRGEQLEFHTDTGYPVYLGVPKITCHYPQTNIFIGKSEVGKTNNFSDFFGRQILRIKSQGKTLYRKKIAILPSDFNLKLLAGTKPNEGTISIICDKPFLYDVISDISFKSVSVQNGKLLELNSDGVPPLYINLAIQANLLTDPIKLKLPFPSKGALLFDGEGYELDRNISVDNLLGARALLFKAPNKSMTEFDIELKAPTSAYGNASFVFHYDVHKSVEEVSLFELRDKIKELLATANSSELDEVVRMIITSPSVPAKQYTIGWNALVGERKDDLLIFDKVDVQEFPELKVELINLSNPDEKPISLTQRLSGGTPIGKFEIPLTRATPKLAVPKKGASIQFRSIFIPPTQTSVLTTEIRSLGKAAEQFHPFYNPTVFESVLNLMASDIEHSGWRYLDKLLENYSHLPMITFEAWKALSKHESCLALLPFATKLAVPTVLQVMQTEFNVVWELIHLDKWQKGKEQYIAFLQKLGFPTELISKYVKDKTDEITDYTALPAVFSGLVGSEAMYSILINTWKDELLRNNADEKIRWPQQYLTKLKPWVLKECRELAIFQAPHDFQASVMFFPIAASAVVSRKATWEEILGNNTINYFLLRQLMEFDRDWFNSVFQSSLSFFQTES